jgi:hypothetical protein
MTLEQAYLIAQILASIAVVVSLIFVALQLRHNSEQMRIAASTGYYEIYRDHMLGATNPELIDLHLRGNETFDTFTLIETGRLFSYYAVITRGYQILHYQASKKVFDDELWENTQNHLADLLLSQAYLHFWTTRRHHFNPSFQDFVDDLIANHPKRKLFNADVQKNTKAETGIPS